MDVNKTLTHTLLYNRLSCNVGNWEHGIKYVTVKQNKRDGRRKERGNNYCQCITQQFWILVQYTYAQDWCMNTKSSTMKKTEQLSSLCVLYQPKRQSWELWMTPRQTQICTKHTHLNRTQLAFTRIQPNTHDPWLKLSKSKHMPWQHTQFNPANLWSFVSLKQLTSVHMHILRLEKQILSWNKLAL